MVTVLYVHVLMLPFDVVLQIDVLREGRVAYRTSKLLLRTMGLHVYLQTSQPGVTLPAVLAPEVPLARVCRHVLFETGRQIKTLLAQIALMLEYLQMVPPIVFPQRFPTNVRPVAVLTGEHSVLTVSLHHVPVPNRIGEEHLIALAALEDRLLLVYLRLVQVPAVFRFEYLPAVTGEALVDTPMRFLV